VAWFKQILTWRSLLETYLNLRSQLDNVDWRASPNRQAVTLIDEAGLHLWVLKAKEALINYELLVVWR
jgi:hypothetical protein